MKKQTRSPGSLTILIGCSAISPKQQFGIRLNPGAGQRARQGILPPSSSEFSTGLDFDKRSVLFKLLGRPSRWKERSDASASSEYHSPGNEV
ncbi:hypothetical protein N7492_004506 [Penicillium capsulatum]|uniref:Uncharacterized protein n=1 Tax=Penicillium capsulatum TaxID=69766 RepID=A0A9W9IA31_9EURO|nr:hypothetical protein N7492_004506 [Penicillium capsulatum]